jgi:hypothetical protein
MRSSGRLSTAGVLPGSPGYGKANVRRGSGVSVGRLVLRHALLAGVALGLVIGSVVMIAGLGIAFTVSGIPVH